MLVTIQEGIWFANNVFGEHLKFYCQSASVKISSLNVASEVYDVLVFVSIFMQQ